MNALLELADGLADLDGRYARYKDFRHKFRRGQTTVFVCQYSNTENTLNGVFEMAMDPLDGETTKNHPYRSRYYNWYCATVFQLSAPLDFSAAYRYTGVVFESRLGRSVHYFRYIPSELSGDPQYDVFMYERAADMPFERKTNG